MTNHQSTHPRRALLSLYEQTQGSGSDSTLDTRAPLEMHPAATRRLIGHAAIGFALYWVTVLVFLYLPAVLLARPTPIAPNDWDQKSTETLMQMLTRKVFPHLKAQVMKDETQKRVLAAFQSNDAWQAVDQLRNKGKSVPGWIFQRVGIPTPLYMIQESEIDLADAIAPDGDEVASDVLAATIAWARKHSPTLRIVQMLAGWVQSLTVFCGILCGLILWTRHRWATLQREVVVSGRLPVPEGAGHNVWNPAEESAARAFIGLERRVGRIFLPLRLLHDIVLSKGENPDEPTRDLIRTRTDSFQTSVELVEYNLVQFLLWVIPSLGFLGTILGIIGAMMAAPDIVLSSDQTQQARVIRDVSLNLGTAFDTTFVALLLQIPLMLFLSQLRRFETSVIELLGWKASLHWPAVLDDHSELRTAALKQEVAS